MDQNPHPQEQRTDVFEVTPTGPGFEALGHENGFHYWWGSVLADALGYSSFLPFRKAIERAMGVMTTLGIPVYENIVFCQRDVGGQPVDDVKLSRFACYLAAMNGNTRLPQVAKAQAYFASFAEAARMQLADADNVERVGIRCEISDHEKALSSTAKQAGVENYAFFQNAGYRGLYNMNLSAIRARKGVPANRSPLDFMGKTELAANLFRVTQTEEKIKNEKIRGQRSLEGAAEEVGKKVRKAMRDISGKTPENLPVAQDLKEIHQQLKSNHKSLNRVDKKDK